MTDRLMTGIRVVAPSTVAVGEPFAVGIKVLTQPHYVGAACYAKSPAVVSRYNHSPRGIRYMDNVLPEYRGAVRLEGGAGYAGPSELSFAEGTGPYLGDVRPVRRVEGVTFATAGTLYLAAVDSETGVTGVSNPIEVTEERPAERLFWGDIHWQTFFSDGLRCPEELYSFARDEAFLDIAAISDHAESLTDRQWEYFSAVTNDFNAPHRFATLLGLEWTSRAWGHRNVYYPGDSGPCLRADDAVYRQLPEVYAFARRHGALVIPHHSANAVMGVDWSLGHDPKVERLVEIHSVWGNSERPASQGNPRPIRVSGAETPGQHVVDALNMGRRYGFLGGGDIHDGRPGDELHAFQEEPPQYRQLHRQGIMGVWAKELTREAVFEALWNRRVFATTNVRVILRFTVNGAFMGTETRADGPVPAFVDVASESPLARIELVGRHGDVAASEPGAREVHWEHELPAPEQTEWYYVRVTREDGEMAWSSPVWVRP